MATIQPDATVQQEKEEKRVVVKKLEKGREQPPGDEDKEEVHVDASMWKVY
jgi:hypothetical protein